MYNFYKQQKVHKVIGDKIETSYKGGDPKVYTVESVTKEGVKLYGVPYAFFNHFGEVESIDVRRCPYILVNNNTKTATSSWQTWTNAYIKPVEE